MKTSHPLCTAWALLGPRFGDNSQVLELARSIGVDVHVKQLVYQRPLRFPNVLIGASLSHLTEESKAQLKAPWPDLVIGIGRRSVPVSKWVKLHSDRPTHMVHLGRPLSPPGQFDLVITTPQYRVPPHPRVIELPLPLSPPRPVAADILAHWAKLWAALPRPLIGVIIGQALPPFSMGAAELAQLGRCVQQLAKAQGGSVLLLASPRTERGAVETVKAELNVPHLSYPVFNASDNPYPAMLQLADQLVVTGDSASMLADAVASAKPVQVFKLPRETPRTYLESDTILAKALAGLFRAQRAMDELVDGLLQAGIVTELGQPMGRPSGYRPPLAEIRSRIEALF